MADHKVGEGRFSLILRGDTIPVARVEQLLALAATRVVRKGEVLNRLPEIVADTDEWVYSISLTTPEGADAELNSLLQHLESHAEAIHTLRETYQVELRMYVQSDYAQIAYCLMPETLRKLVAIGLPLGVSSLSWGEIAL